ncbi:glycosyltransferase [Arthrobacter sp. AFG20]|uniref:glycosyltransferase n=1 Tax=Arthrobacter sp. AFG20 TaxID=1688671 RepID=UPI0011AF34F5|nr:glycosyltransferase [Arthrobacter sp. AFG20]
MRNLVIVQPYVPKYRLSFFSRLIGELEHSNIRCRIAAAMPSGHQANRMDAASADWLIPIRHRLLHLGHRTVTLGGAAESWAGADGVIVGHLGSSFDTYRAIVDARWHRNFRVGLWGHIKSYVSDSNPVDAMLERWQLRQADHVFAYSSGGSAYAATAGVSPKRLTTVMNTVDTRSLAWARESLREAEVSNFMSRHGLRRGRTLGFIGGLDESKRISFLAATLDQLWTTDPDIRLVVGGSGAQSNLLDASVSRGQTIRLGYAGPADQALIGRSASALIMPGRIGLIAVDALVLKIPILTTNWRYHSAESEYLVEGVSRFTSENDVESFATLVHGFMRHKSMTTPDQSCQSWKYPTIDDMVANFSTGVLRMFDEK